MARKQVVEIECSRCDRVEYREGLAPDLKKGMDCEATFRKEDGTAVHVMFDDLCGPCRRSVLALLEQIGRTIDGVSPDREQKSKTTEAKKKGAAANGPAPTPHAPTVSKNAPARSS